MNDALQIARVRLSWAALALSLLLFGSFPVSALAAGSGPVSQEDTLIAQARTAAGRDEHLAVDASLLAESGLASQAAPSVTLARRAMAVCGWLRNDNEPARAMRLAERVVERLATMKESSTADRVERLYWEAMLLSGILDRKAEALALLQEAEELAPDDDRILQCELQLAQALAEFGR